MTLAHKILPHYTYNDWIQWKGRWELLDGFPIAMSPAPAPKHQKIASAIKTELTLALRNSKCNRYTVYDPIDYKVSDDTILEPDALIVCGDIDKPYLDFPPALVVEVLSPSTVLRDRHTKYEIYEQQGVKYYLIADPKEETIELYDLTDGKYALKPFDKIVSLSLDDSCHIQADFSFILK